MNCVADITIQATYRLEGARKEGTFAQHISSVTEIWKGKYKGKKVATEGFSVLHYSACHFDRPFSVEQAPKVCLPFYGIATWSPALRHRGSSRFEH